MAREGWEKPFSHHTCKPWMTTACFPKAWSGWPAWRDAWSCFVSSWAGRNAPWPRMPRWTILLHRFSAFLGKPSPATNSCTSPSPFAPADSSRQSTQLTSILNSSHIDFPAVGGLPLYAVWRHGHARTCPPWTAMRQVQPEMGARHDIQSAASAHRLFLLLPKTDIWCTRLRLAWDSLEAPHCLRPH